MPVLREEIVIVSPMGHGNALGRALALADLAAEAVARVTVVAPDDGPVWPAAKRWDNPVNRVRDEADLMTLFGSRRPGWIWVVKPLKAGWDLGRALAERLTEAVLILDVDDDDEALSREFVSGSLLNRARIYRLHQLRPANVRAVRQEALTRVDGVTVASFAVADRLGLSRERTLRVPHPRRKVKSAAPRRCDGSASKRIGFFGTIRRHKGVSDLEALVRSDSEVVLHVFEESGLDKLARETGRVVEYPVDYPWERLYGSVDVVTLPQSRTSGGEVQVPAKLLDAMRCGAAILSTPTPAIVEIAGESVAYLDDWAAPRVVGAALDETIGRLGELGRLSQERFDSTLALEENIEPLADFLTVLSRRKEEG